MSWTPLQIVWSHEADSDLERLDRAMLERVVAAVERYAQTGHGDVKPLRGQSGLFRLRVGSWRVLFELVVDESGMLVLRVLARGRAYR